MSSTSQFPDYSLDDLRVVTATAELKAAFHPLREQLLDLVLERAATVAELAEAVGRPKSSVAYHVNVLLEAELLKVVRTRRVRAIDERFYGRTARIFYVGEINRDQLQAIPNILTNAAADSVPAHAADDLRAIVRHARIARRDAAEFWQRVADLAQAFSELPRTGDETFRFVAGLYPTDYPSLPSPESES
ncbi:ArsR/SmtB family transcription factor [Spelaeicoccus albus]|uniref:DNA-binding transcriptional ArsR family regulator n=1 Tax=Spelaeicoccus albus TaxID=1280376 RepID=A0A7Z0AAD0_9MICO|nr:winged helix-turn-helix domain-containing protein [Spelaeicoccus albus]NYI66541.1 DNA-binding transcriptional ArsR family regulator [Spelaeicoccus albus]